MHRAHSLSRNSPKYGSSNRTNSPRWIVLLVVALLAAGCTGWPDGPDWGGGRAGISGRATVQIGGYTFPLYGARIVVGSSHGGFSQTNRNGHYSYGRLAAGNHRVTLQALHGTYSDSIYVRGDGQQPQTLDWRVRPKGLDSELFFHLSGLRSLYVNDRGHFSTVNGDLVRWEKSLIRVHFDVYGAPHGFDPYVADQYWREVRRWESRLDRRITFARTTDPYAADIVVSWVPEGWLGDHAGIAKHVAFYANGALKRVEIEIDVAWADYPGLWEHEFAHAMGVDHVRDAASVMYPYLGYNQRKTLSTKEIAHVRLMYDIPSGQRLSWSGGYGTLGMLVGDGDGDVDDESNIDGGPDEWFDGVDGELSKDAPITGRREHVLYLDEALRR